MQLAYGDDLSAGLWLFEGTARSMEDLAFTNIDNWPGSLSAPFSFNQQVNTYLANTNVDLTSDPQRYNSALWWKYFTEQFGTVNAEPQRGVDALVKLWEATTGLDGIAAVNKALTDLSASKDFDAAFRRFTAANWAKNLSNQPDASYNYIDEDQVGNPAPYGPVVSTLGGSINVGSPMVQSNQSISRYGARYYQATPGGTCPLVNATFHTDFGPAFYHVITQKGNALVSHVESTGSDFTRSFFNDGLTKIVAIAGSTNAAAQVDVKLQCANPVIDIKMPNTGAKANVGPHDTPGKFLAQVLVTDGAGGPVISGLTVSDFKAKINGANALITTGGFIQQQYWLTVQAPPQASDGDYDLRIDLEQSGTSTSIANDTNSSSVAYNSNRIDHVLVLDRSGSMASDNKMVAARTAAKFYVDVTLNNDGLAVVPYNQDVNPTPFPMQASSLAVRGAAKTYINGIAAGGATSIGDGLQEAVNQRNANITGNPNCSFVLLSDGMENSAALWADVQASVLATHCPVTTIAFGAATDEGLMQAIATATGGIYLYNDVYPALATADVNAVNATGNTFLSLDNSYEYVQAQAEGRQRLLAEEGVVPMNQDEIHPGPDQVHKVMIDDSVGEARFALDWVSLQGPLDCGRSCFTPELTLKLRQPNGKVIDSKSMPYDIDDPSNGHVGWRISKPMTGTWELLVNSAIAYVSQPVPYQVLVSGRTNLSVQLILPDRTGAQYLTGNRVPIAALLSSDAPIGNARVVAEVTAGDGSVSKVMLYDDGQHQDGAAGDGYYMGYYTKVNQAQSVPPTGEDIKQPQPPDEGSYRVRLLVDTDLFHREALGSFTVQAGPDTNENGLPDPYEKENNVDQQGSDHDLDLLTALDEYHAGTDPNNSDSDGGGENDGSEIEHGQNPLDPSDDKILPPQYFQVVAGDGVNHLAYHVRRGYNTLLLYRSQSADGPWTLQNAELSIDRQG